MRFPVLQSPANPNAPRSAPAILKKPEINRLARLMVAILGVDRENGRFEVLGSGFVISAIDHLQILTASHLIYDFASKLSEQKPHALQNLDLDEDLRLEQRHINKVLGDGVIQILLQAGSPPNHKTVLQDAFWCSFGSRPEHFDEALIQCNFPEGTTAGDFVPLLFDDSPFDISEPVALAGFHFLFEERFIPFDDEAELFRLRARIRIDSGFITQHIEPTIVSGYRTHKRFNVGIPSRGGMSGGPMIRVRFPLASPSNLIATPPIELWTAAGITSRGGLFDETKVVAIEEALHSEALFADGKLTIKQEIERQMIPTYADVAERIREGKYLVLPDGMVRFL